MFLAVGLPRVCTSVGFCCWFWSFHAHIRFVILLPTSIRGVFLVVDSVELFLAAMLPVLPLLHFLCRCWLLAQLWRTWTWVSYWFVLMYRKEILLAWFGLCLTTWRFLLRFGVLLWITQIRTSVSAWWCWIPCGCYGVDLCDGMAFFLNGFCRVLLGWFPSCLLWYFHRNSMLVFCGTVVGWFRSGGVSL